MKNGNYNLKRFVDAQKEIYDIALKEIKSGGKYTHWMWFIFPQIAGLGSSYSAQKFAISSVEEAKAYMAHPVLGSRLLECSKAILALPAEICPAFLGYIDSLKLCSSMTLFATATPEHKIFQDVIDKFYGGEMDQKTIALLAR